MRRELFRIRTGAEAIQGWGLPLTVRGTAERQDAMTNK
jgi:hypothetical protein